MTAILGGTGPALEPRFHSALHLQGSGHAPGSPCCLPSFCLSCPRSGHHNPGGQTGSRDDLISAPAIWQQRQKWKDRAWGRARVWGAKARGARSWEEGREGVRGQEPPGSQAQPHRDHSTPAQHRTGPITHQQVSPNQGAWEDRGKVMGTYMKKKKKERKWRESTRASQSGSSRITARDWCPAPRLCPPFCPTLNPNFLGHLPNPPSLGTVPRT